MEIKKIRQLASLLEEFNLEELSLQEGDSDICLRRAQVSPPALTTLPTIQVETQTRSMPEPSPSPASSSDDADLVTVSSPMVGMFYTASSPQEPPLVTVGQTVRAGDVLCIIEAMKLMNEIVAEQDGVITQCYHRNEQLVEFGQPLFQMRCN